MTERLGATGAGLALRALDADARAVLGAPSARAQRLLPGVAAGVAPGNAPPPDPRATLRRLAHQLEGVFLNQLFQAMRSSVPQDEASNDQGGEALFTALMDERVADVASQRMERGIGEALYHQLARRLTVESDAAVGRGQDAPGSAAMPSGSTP